MSRVKMIWLPGKRSSTRAATASCMSGVDVLIRTEEHLSSVPSSSCMEVRGIFIRAPILRFVDPDDRKVAAEELNGRADFRLSIGGSLTVDDDFHIVLDHTASL